MAKEEEDSWISLLMLAFFKLLFLPFNLCFSILRLCFQIVYYIIVSYLINHVVLIGFIRLRTIICYFLLVFMIGPISLKALVTYSKSQNIQKNIPYSPPTTQKSSDPKNSNLNGTGNINEGQNANQNGHSNIRSRSRSRPLLDFYLHSSLNQTLNFNSNILFQNGNNQTSTQGQNFEKNDSKINNNIEKNQLESDKSSKDKDNLTGVEEKKKSKGIPLVIFIQGGGWISVHKNIFSPLGTILQPHCYVAIPNYTPFPKATLEQMVEQIKNCITWATENIEKYGGDKDQIYICAISTGAHLVNLALLSELETYLQKLQHTRTKENAGDWIYGKIKGLIYISGIYDLSIVYENMKNSNREAILAEITRGKENFHKYSPKHIFEKIQKKYPNNNLCSIVPPITMTHGSQDKISSIQSAIDFEIVLKQSNIQTKLIVHESETHLEPIIEAIEGFSNSRLVNDILNVVTSPSPRKIDYPFYWKFKKLVLSYISPI